MKTLDILRIATVVLAAVNTVIAITDFDVTEALAWVLVGIFSWSNIMREDCCQPDGEGR